MFESLNPRWPPKFKVAAIVRSFIRIYVADVFITIKTEMDKIVENYILRLKQSKIIHRTNPQKSKKWPPNKTHFQ